MRKIFTPYIDLDGNPVERTPHSHRYSYDAFVVWDNRENVTPNSSCYSDRLLQRDYGKTRELSKKHFGESGDYWGGRAPEKIEAFLSEYFGKKIRLAVIMEGCNIGNGYPYWIFYYNSEQ